MSDDQKLIDLPPNQWKSEREKPREPFFGSGIWGALAYVVGFAAALGLAYYFRQTL